MPCDTRILREKNGAQRLQDALDRLKRALEAGTVKAVIGANGALAFKGLWRSDGVSDLCAYRLLTAANSPELRRALARAEVTAGRKLDARAVASGLHSHDGGATWNEGH